MAKNKTTITAASVNDFIDSVTDLKKRQDCYQIIDLFSAQTGLQPQMWGASIVGFGSYHYVYASGHSGDAPLAAFSPRTSAMVLYLASDPMLRDDLLAKLGKHKSSKGCIYIKKLADINTEVLKTLVQQSVSVLQKQYPSTNA
ncbi:DUF1801 domain-containing protein [Pedobacter duraquae]|uniref:Uncharacterized protein DUF1801 n=1 Tax=Pedobacter duraquae TaxID=425511 RepID=A0A4R6IQ55_9SPHI|nr:DUF1801 domain-containing protein [Pedobacter duraquae]TDO24452.1 uncharacterized protein DUF1801 [Pedobacter duraquae]